MTTRSLVDLRADTPGTTHRNHLDNAGAGLMPRPVIDAISDHIALEAEIGGYQAARARQREVETVYDDIAALLEAPSRNVAIVANATAGFIQAMSAFDFAPGDAIVTTRCDYTSYQITFNALAERLGVVVHRADDLPEGGVDPDSVRALLRAKKPRIVHVSWVPTNSGLVQDVESVGEVCESEGVPYLVDACQAIGQIPIDVARLRCDYLSVTARKFLRGPRGIGFLYASDRALARGDHPLFIDMRGATWTGADSYAIADGARRFEDWEFPYALVMGLGAAARYARDVGVEWAGSRARALATSLRDKLRAIDGVRTLDRGIDPCAIVTADVAGLDADELSAELERRGINTSSSARWFGLLDFTEKNVESALRLSPHYYNTEEEISQVVAVLGDLVSKNR